MKKPKTSLEMKHSEEGKKCLLCDGEEDSRLHYCSACGYISKKELKRRRDNGVVLTEKELIRNNLKEQIILHLVEKK